MKLDIIDRVNEKKYTYEDIHELFQNLSQEDMWFMYSCFMRDIERQRAESTVEKNYCFEKITPFASKVTPDIYIIKTIHNENKEERYHYSLNGEHSYRSWDNYDEALLAALCQKYIGQEGIAKIMWRLFK